MKKRLFAIASILTLIAVTLTVFTPVLAAPQAKPAGVVVTLTQKGNILYATAYYASGAPFQIRGSLGICDHTKKYGRCVGPVAKKGQKIVTATMAIGNKGKYCATAEIDNKPPKTVCINTK